MTEAARRWGRSLLLGGRKVYVEAGPRARCSHLSCLQCEMGTRTCVLGAAGRMEWTTRREPPARLPAQREAGSIWVPCSPTPSCGLRLPLQRECAGEAMGKLRSGFRASRSPFGTRQGAGTSCGLHFTGQEMQAQGSVVFYSHSYLLVELGLQPGRLTCTASS